MRVAGSWCCAAETNNVIKQLYSNKNLKRKGEEIMFFPA